MDHLTTFIEKFLHDPKVKKEFEKVLLEIIVTEVGNIEEEVIYNRIRGNLWNFIEKALDENTNKAYKKGYFKGVIDSEYGQVNSEELLK